MENKQTLRVYLRRVCQRSESIQKMNALFFYLLILISEQLIEVKFETNLTLTKEIDVENL